MVWWYIHIIAVTFNAAISFAVLSFTYTQYCNTYSDYPIFGLGSSDHLIQRDSSSIAQILDLRNSWRLTLESLRKQFSMLNKMGYSSVNKCRGAKKGLVVEIHCNIVFWTRTNRKSRWIPIVFSALGSSTKWSIINSLRTQLEEQGSPIRIRCIQLPAPLPYKLRVV